MLVAPFRSVAYITGRWHRNAGVPLTSYKSGGASRKSQDDFNSVQETKAGVSGRVQRYRSACPGRSFVLGITQPMEL